MHIHILGICGTFMSGIAMLAKQQGYDVTGSDMNVYPPISTQLNEQGIELMEGYEASHIPQHVDCIVVGNVVKRGNPAIEYVLNHQIPYCSGPEWLLNNILHNRWVLSVAGTHGKTTTSSLLAWILEVAGLFPGFLIGGVPENFGVSARLGSMPFFVVEADEYDSAFFDKRSKFIHYRPKTQILNNLEYDHADIFTDLSAIQQQFHYLVRTIPGDGLIISNAADQNLKTVLEMGCFTKMTTFGAEDAEWQARLCKADGSEFVVIHHGKEVGSASWNLLGLHNVNNALAAVIAANHIGILPRESLAAIKTFKNVKRRLEVKGEKNGVVVYDDFAHHPTAIAATLAGLRAKIGQKARIIAVLEFGSYTMRTGVHKEAIPQALSTADMIICKNTQHDWGLSTVLDRCPQFTAAFNDSDELVKNLIPKLQAGDHVVVMSNAGFDNIHQKLLNAIE